MRAHTRTASPDEVASIWCAVRESHVFNTYQDFACFYDHGPWRVRVNDQGDAYVLHRWRAHLDIAALHGLWAPPRRVPDLIADAKEVAARHGLRRVMSPLLQKRRSGPYLEAGMEPMERLVAFTMGIGTMKARPTKEYRVESAGAEAVSDLVALDRACFGPIWRHGVVEVTEAMNQGAHVTLVRDDTQRAVAGAAISALSGSVVTVGRLATAPWARRRGIATALLWDAHEWARSCGAVGLSLCTQAGNGPARRLYGAAGFVEAPEEYVLLVTGRI